MNRFIVSAGLVAVGATGLKAAYAPGLTRQQLAKPWSASLALRGFYDDNYTTQPSDVVNLATNEELKKESLGFEVNPTIAVNFPGDQTYLGASYSYSMKYYTDSSRSDDPIDHSHEFNLNLDHRFSERYSARLEDSFAYSQEPEILGDLGAPLRTESDAFRNRASLAFDAQLTEKAGVELGYQNTWYDYTQEADDIVDPVNNPSGAGSRSALLDRFEHLFHVDGRYQVQENTVGILGYQFGLSDYTSPDPLFDPALGLSEGSDRNSTTHYGYVGAEHRFTSQFTGNGKVGVQFTDYDEQNTDAVSPYVDLGASYAYLPGSSVQMGFLYQRNATDIVQPDAPGGDITTDQESAIVYAAIVHRITAQLTATLSGNFQHSIYEGGVNDGSADNLFTVGLNLEHRFNEHLSAEVGYNFDRLDSDIALRSFTRNRVYIGARASY